jgi:hypothetical protein
MREVTHWIGSSSQKDDCHHLANLLRFSRPKQFRRAPQMLSGDVTEAPVYASSRHPTQDFACPTRFRPCTQVEILSGGSGAPKTVPLTRFMGL